MRVVQINGGVFGSTGTIMFGIAETLKKNGYGVYALEAGGEEIYAEDFSGNVALVVGGEDSGVRRLTKQKCDKVLSIPLQGQVNSLNASVALGIAAYEVVRKRLKK